MSVLLAGLRLQMLISLRRLDELQVLALVPFAAVLYLTMLAQTGRRDLAIVGVLASYVTAVWSLAIYSGGDLIDEERRNGTFASLLVTPVSVAQAMFGRVLAISLLGLVALVESGVVAVLFFHIDLGIDRPWLLAGIVVLLTVAMAGATYLFAAVFLLTSHARSWQNAMSYPAFVLGGVLAPLRAWPIWVQVPGRLFFLSWVMDLFAVATGRSTGGVLLPALAAGGLVAITWWLAWEMVRWAIRRVQATGAFDGA
ncbi:MAG TPA: ABC transporter permease [Jatrophihabitans sp.]|jgi:ABC-2 type transport system permease protein|uniref:ABC transporter permease n=1 Tax=Jatrophihabitans sp. TaxID=1932789 RepID=UPI002F16ECCD